MRTEYSESGLFFLPLRCKNRKYYQAKTRKRRRSPRDGPEPGRAAVRARDTNPKNDESARQRQSRGRQQARTDARLPDGQHSAERGRSGTQRSLCRPGPDRRHGARSVVNVGHRPTVGNGPDRVLEAHLLDFEGDLYGQTIEVELLEFLREERRFGSTEELSRQIEADKKRARERLRRDSDL